MEIYLHDRSAAIQFVLKGQLMGEWVQHLEHAWGTALSVLAGKELVVELSGVTGTDPFGLALLSRMRESGARLTASRPPESEAVYELLGVPKPRSSGRSNGCRALRFLRLARLCG